MVPGNNLDLRQVAYFVQVAELGSFSKAAATLSIAQSALSRGVATLERRLGTRLLHRTGRGVALTEEGQRALPAMQALLASADQLMADIASAKEDLVGTVSLGMLTSLTSVLLTPLLRAIHERFPRLKMSVREGLTHHVEEWLAAGTVDLAILYGSRPTPRATDQLLLKTDLHLIGAPGEHAVRNKSVRLAELAHLPLLLPAQPNRHRALIERVFTEHRVPFNVAFELDSVPTMKDLAAIGRKFTILPLHAVYKEVSGGFLQASRIIDPTISRRVFLTHATQRQRNRLSREVERLIVETVSALIASGQLPARR